MVIGLLFEITMISPVKVWRNQKYVARMIGKIGVIVSWSIVRTPPADFGYQAPYIIAIVKLDDGQSICAQVADCQFSDVAFGKRVKTIVRRTIQADTNDVIPYGIKVKLL